MLDIYNQETKNLDYAIEKISGIKKEKNIRDYDINLNDVSYGIDDDLNADYIVCDSKKFYFSRSGRSSFYEKSSIPLSYVYKLPRDLRLRCVNYSVRQDKDLVLRTTHGNKIVYAYSPSGINSIDSSWIVNYIKERLPDFSRVAAMFWDDNVIETVIISDRDSFDAGEGDVWYRGVSIVESDNSTCGLSINPIIMRGKTNAFLYPNKKKFSLNNFWFNNEKQRSANSVDKYLNDYKIWDICQQYIIKMIIAKSIYIEDPFEFLTDLLKMYRSGSHSLKKIYELYEKNESDVEKGSVKNSFYSIHNALISFQNSMHKDILHKIEVQKINSKILDDIL